MFKFLQHWLRHSSRIHLRQGEVTNMRELVELFDRFLDGPMAYDLEWDDFISWKNSNPNIEKIRERLGNSERLLFSELAHDKSEYRAAVCEERDLAAALCGIPARKNS